MPQRTVRARQLPDGHFEFLEPVHIATPAEFEVIVNEPADTPAGAPYFPPARDLGPMTEPLTRDVIYGELV